MSSIHLVSVCSVCEQPPKVKLQKGRDRWDLLCESCHQKEKEAQRAELEARRKVWLSQTSAHVAPPPPLPIEPPQPPPMKVEAPPVVVDIKLNQAPKPRPAAKKSIRPLHPRPPHNENTVKTRRAILEWIRRGRKWVWVGELMEEFYFMNEQTIRKHLRGLVSDGCLHQKKGDRDRLFYYLTPSFLTGRSFT